MTRPRRPTWGIIATVFLSGAATLVLEQAWTRQLGLAIGRSHAALLAVSVAFMAGLALGPAASTRAKTPLQVVGLCHAAAGLLGFAFPLFTLGLERLLACLYQSGSHLSLSLVSGLGYTLAVILMLVPAALLGTALPLAIRQQRAAGRENCAGILAGASTLGACLGCLAAGLLLLPALGTIATGRAGGLLALLAAALAFSQQDQPALAARAPATARPAYRCLALLAGAGALAMVLELSWIRYFTQVFGSTTFAITVILAGCLLSSGLGSLLAGVWVSRREGPPPGPWALGAPLVLAGAACLALLYPMGKLPVWLVRAFAANTSLSVVTAGQLLLTTLVVVVPMAALGSLLPLGLATTGQNDRDPGPFVAAGTAGAVIGCLLWADYLVPKWTLLGTFLIATACLVATGLLWGSGRVSAVLALVVLGLTFRLAPPRWRTEVMASGSYQYGAMLAKKADSTDGDMLHAIESYGRILYFADGPDASVAVREEPDGTRTLLIDGKADAATLRDMRTQRLLGHLPTLWRANGQALVIGLGAGVTAGTVATHPFNRVDVVEILPDVIGAAPLFTPDNRAVLADPRINLINGDGHSYVNWTGERYDLITSEPTNPWVSGAASLFTREFFKNCKRILAPGGVICQWLPAYQQSKQDFRATLAAFVEAFPQASLWESARGHDYILMAQNQPQLLTLECIKTLFAVRPFQVDLEEVELRDAPDLLARYVCGSRALAQLAQGAEPITDDRLQLEWSGPRNRIEQRGGDEIASMLNSFTEDATALLDSAPPGMVQEIHARKLKELALERLRVSDVAGAQALLARAQQEVEALGQVPLFLKGFFLAAVRENVARGQSAEAYNGLDRLKKLFGEDPDVENERGQLMLRDGKAREAQALYQKLTEKAPEYSHGWRNLGVVCAALNEFPQAIQAFQRAADLVPQEPELHNLLAKSLYVQGRVADAHREYLRSVWLDPCGVEATAGLAMVRRVMGRPENGDTGRI